MKTAVETLALYNLSEDFWLQKLKGVTLNPVFGDRQDQEKKSSNTFAIRCIPFPARATDLIDIVTGESDTNAFLIFMTAFQILIYRYTGLDDILIGTADFRTDEGTISNDVLLFFRTEINEENIVRDLLNQCLNQLNSIYENHLFQYESFLKRFCDGKIGDREALSAVGLIYDTFNLDSRRIEEMDLLFKIIHHETGYNLFVRYHTGCFTPEQVGQLGQHFLNILTDMMEDLDRPVQRVSLLTPGEQQKLAGDFAGKEVVYQPGEEIFLSIFQCQAANTPQNQALAYENNILSYRELNEHANRLARLLLKEVLLGTDALVPIIMERSDKMVIGIIAVWKCGAAYVPIDPSYPAERIETIIKDSGATLIISETGMIPSDLEKTLAAFTKILYLDQVKEKLMAEDSTDLCTVTHPGDLAYVIYTSGSTGKPKGVMIEQRGMMNHLHAKLDELNIDSGSVIAQNASHCFDISIWQFFAALLKGGKTIVYTDKVVLSPEIFIKQLGEQGVNILEVVPSYLAMMLDLMADPQLPGRFPALNYLLVTGESLKPGLVKRWFEKFPGIKMVNAYGPTEASDDITQHELNGPIDQIHVPIGKPLQNFVIYILDERMQLCPIGIKGEICVSGIGVGRGYLNRPELTAEKFINFQHSAFDLPRILHSNLYKTGDIGRYLPDGNIEFFGRKDYQVKVRGFRIELEEIENKLSIIPGIHNAVVIDREDKAGNTYLCAYITLTGLPGPKRGQAEIKSELSKTLPDYMVPSYIITLDKLPLTPNGKVDRKALPEPGETGAGPDDYVAPRDDAEKKLAEIWCQVMGVERIGIHDNFFSLGGNSLLGIRIVNKIQEWLLETVHVTILFLAPTIAQLAEKLASYKIEKETRIGKAEIAEIRSLIEPLAPLPAHLSSTVKTPPVMFVLCPSRSGSTLLRVILAGHPKLFAPQEFELLSFNTLPERNEALSGKFGLYLEGVIRAIMELKNIDADEAKAIMTGFEAQGMTVREFYGILQSWLGDRILVEKTPQYTYDMNVLRRAEEYFDSALYIHLVRNPYAVIHSYENARLDQLFKYEHRFSSRELGELLWIICHQNILEFLETVPPARKFRLKYEEMVGNPPLVIGQMCRHFGLEFEPRMLDVYGDAGNRMTDGIYAESKMLGDVKFFTHSSIDTGSVEKWKQKYKTPFLGETAVELAKYFGYTWEQARYTKIEPVVSREHYQLSPSQKRLWILDRLEEADSHIAYNVPGAYWLTGNLNIGALEKSYETVIDRHEILRTTFITIDGEPRQKVHDFVSLGFKWEHIDLRDDKDRVEKAKILAGKEASSPFDLEHGPLLRTKTIRLEEDQYLFLFTMHHIISDGWSMNVLVKEILALYGAYQNNRENPLPPLQFQYRDYSEWLNGEAMRLVLEKQEKYWLEEFAGEVPVLHLPLDYTRPAVMSFAGSAAGFGIDKEQTEALVRLARSEGVSNFIVLAAVFNIFLAKISGQEDIIIGTPTAGRHHPGLENILGMLVNTLALRSSPKGEMPFTQYLQQFRATVWGAFENQDYPFETLVEKVVINRDMGHNPLFDVMFSLRDAYEAGTYPSLPGHEIKPFAAEHVTSKFDLSLIASEQEGSLYFSCEYCTKLFREETIQRFFEYLTNAANAITQNPLLKISQIEIIPAEEKKQILFEFNDTAAEYPKDKTLHDLFAEQAVQTPDTVVLVARETREKHEKHITYFELNEQSDHMAGVLIEKGVLPDTIVGIMMERSVEMIVGILGILKSGGAYLPIDPDYPQERIDYMLKDSSAAILLTDLEMKRMDNCQLSIVNNQLSMEKKLAYVIYTSGSTGRPKGTLVEHRSLVNLCCWHNRYYNVTARDKATQYAGCGFDASVWEIFPYLIQGAALHILADDIKLDIQRLGQYFNIHQISIGFLPSQFAQAFIQEWKELRTLRALLIGGDKLNYVVDTNYQLYNNYGPTENTVVTTSYLIENRLAIIPIGKPIANTSVYVFDKWLKPIPIGVIGELYIGGVGVSRGYLNRPELTAEKFLHPSALILRHSNLYRTGDLARWLPAGPPAGGASGGVIEFLGRIDHQVKIRGFRIELGEIENQLLKHKHIKEAVVVINEDAIKDKNLTAYIISAEELLESELREYLQEKLPEYMIPSHFVQLEKIPLTPNGKIDRKALPKPELKVGDSYIAPRDEIEKKMTVIWSEVLDQTSIGIDDNFFYLGGHSLKATVLVSKIHKVFQANVPLTEIFKTPTIMGLANYIKAAIKDKHVSIEAVEKKEYYSLSSAQKRLYVLYQMDLQGVGYNIPFFLVLEGEIDKEKLGHTFRRLIHRHESLRTSFHIIGDEPVQRIHDEVAFEIEKLDGRGAPPWSPDIIWNFIRPFDLSKAPLLRVRLVREKEDRHILMVDMHHIISDGTSMNILVKDFMALYQGEDLSELRLQYKDFSIWQKDEKQAESLKRQENFWLNEFAGEIPVLELPADYPRPAVQSFEGHRIPFEIDKESTVVLKALTLKTGATLYMLLLALYNVFLSKVTGREEIITGSPIAGRRHTDLAEIIGMFVNTLALRNYPSGEKKFTDFLEEVKGKTLKAFENQDYQYEDLVERVVIGRDTSRNPLFDTMFALQNMETAEINIPGLKLSPYPYENKTAKFDLSLTAFEAEEKLVFNFEYSTKLFKEETANRFISYFKNVIKGVIENKERRISDFEILTEEEKKIILFDFNNTEAEYPKDKTIHQLFAEQVSKSPDRIAAVGSTLETLRATSLQIQMSYRQLNEQSDHLAGLLFEKGVLPDTIVGIMVERSVEMVIGILGILKSGGAYLPIDPEYPRERIEYMLKDSGTKLLVTATDEDGEKVRKWEGEMVLLEFINRHPDQLSSHHSSFIVHHSNHLAYIIYTSGSTGKPKGVLITHRSFIDFTTWAVDEFEHRVGYQVLLSNSYASDGSIQQIFPPLISGGTLHLIDKELRLDMARYLDYLKTNKINNIDEVPVLMKELVAQFDPNDREEKLPDLTCLSLGSETVPIDLVKKCRRHLNHHGRIINAYGPAEASVETTTYHCDGTLESEQSLIGKPRRNIRVYILDEAGHLCPIGVRGEICISGVGLARGYLNQPELTAEKFNRSYRSHKTYILYKTGDRGCWLPDGNIRFFGRIDNQIKIRGYRVELQEIENILKTHHEIKDAVVLTRETAAGETEICAYYVPKAGTGLLLREYLEKRLPSYMIPAHLIELEKIPLTPNGKVDKNALPEPTAGSTGEFLPPRNEIEKKLVEIWAEVLNRSPEAIGVHADFFKMGGHSLKVTLLTSRMQKKLEVEIPIVQVFKTPTISGLAEYLKTTGKSKCISIEPVELREYYELTPVQKRLYILQQIAPDSPAYNVPTFITLDKCISKETLTEIFKKIIQRHEILRTSYEILHEEPRQKVHDKVEFEIEILGRGDPVWSFIRPFDLSIAPLLRVGLIKEEDNTILAVDMHHIICDPISHEVLAGEFNALYNDDVLPGLKLQYKDYAGWQNSEIQKGKINQQENYWLNLLSGDLSVLELPVDFPRPQIQSFEGASLGFILGWVETQRLKNIAQNHNVTYFMIILALFNVLLLKIGGQENIIVGTSISRRQHEDIEKMIGMFINTLALRNEPVGNKTFGDFLQEIKINTLAAYSNADYPFEDLVEKIAVNRDTSRNPLFDVMFNYLQNTVSQIEIPGLKFASFEYKNKTAKFDLTLTCIDIEEKFFLNFAYSTKLFKLKTIEKLINYFKNIVNQIISNPTIKIMEVEIISEEIRKVLLNHFNENLIETFEIMPIQSRLKNIFLEYKKNTVIEYGTTCLTYAELEHRASCISQWFAKNNIPPGSFIGIYSEDKAHVISAIMGILQMGCIFVPLDTVFPEKRIEKMIRLTGMRAILTDAIHETILAGMKEKVPNVLNIIALDDSFYHSHGLEENNHPLIVHDPEDMIYVYFTSGSTGQPNAIVGKNKSLVQFLQWEIDTFAVDETYRVSQLTGVGFDAFLRDIFVPLLAGGVICIPRNKEILMNSSTLIDWLDTNQINLVHCVPSLFRIIDAGQLTPATFSHLKYVLLSGEPINPTELQSWYRVFGPRIQLVNYYGPTETTMIKTFHLITMSDIEAGKIPAGRPIRGTRLIILDKHMKICDRGIMGEIYIRTAYGTHGYFHNPSLNAQRFIKNPFSDAAEDVIYKTGDLGRQLENGEIEVLGRIDRQVKIRGVRIELENIENSLLKHDKIERAIVISRKSGTGENFLCAYLLFKKQETLSPSPSELREHLAKELPDYMIPSYFIPIEKIPLTPNGKLDIKALPNYETKVDGGYIAPRNAIEEKLVELWVEILGTKKELIGIDSNFFELGGHSLKSNTLVFRIHKELDVKLPLVEVFKNNTIRTLSEYIMKSGKGKYLAIELIEKKDCYDVSFGQNRVWLLSQSPEASLTFNMQSLYLLREEINIGALNKAFDSLIERHENLRTVFPATVEEVKQKIVTPVELDFHVNYHDLRDAEDREKQIRAFMTAEAETLFDLRNGPLLRAKLIRSEEKEYLLLCTMHHIIADFLSMEVLQKEFLQLYDAFKNDRANPLKPLKFQYKEFACWQNKQLAGRHLEKLREYWGGQFNDKIPVLQLPYDKQRPRIQSYNGETAVFSISPNTTAQLRAIGNENGATLFMVLMASVNIFLSFYSGQNDIIIGTPASGREHPDLENQIGFYLNTLALRIKFKEEEPFTQLLQTVKTAALGAYEHQMYPFDKLIDEFKIKREPGRHPLFDVMVDMINLTQTPPPREGAEPAEPVENDRDPEFLEIAKPRAKFDLVIYFYEGSREINVVFEYNTDLFKRKTITRMVKRYRKLLGDIIKNPLTSISKLLLAEQVQLPSFGSFINK